MAEDQVDAAPVAVEKPKEKTKAASTKPKKPADHPKYAEMVKEALKTLKNRGGSSRQAIMKYIAQNYKLGEEDKSVHAHLKMALKAGVKNGTLKQLKGVGASGSFKLGTDVKEAKKTSKATKSPKKEKAVAAKKIVKKTKVETKKSPKPKALPAKKSSEKKPAMKENSPKKEVKKVAAAKPKPKPGASPKAVKKAAKPATTKSKKASPAKSKK